MSVEERGEGVAAAPALPQGEGPAPEKAEGGPGAEAVEAPAPILVPPPVGLGTSDRATGAMMVAVPATIPGPARHGTPSQGQSEDTQSEGDSDGDGDPNRKRKYSRTPEEKKAQMEKRKMNNRGSAKEHRDKKENYMCWLETQKFGRALTKSERKEQPAWDTVMYPAGLPGVAVPVEPYNRNGVAAPAHTPPPLGGHNKATNKVIAAMHADNCALRQRIAELEELSSASLMASLAGNAGLTPQYPAQLGSMFGVGGGGGLIAPIHGRQNFVRQGGLPLPQQGGVPGQNGMIPGMVPGMVPGIVPGMMPSAMPGAMPGAMHGAMRGAMPGASSLPTDASGVDLGMSRGVDKMGFVDVMNAAGDGSSDALIAGSNANLGTAAANLQHASVTLHVANLQQANAAQNLQNRTAALQQQIQQQQLSQHLMSMHPTASGHAGVDGAMSLGLEPPSLPGKPYSMPAPDRNGTTRLPSKHQEIALRHIA